MRPVLLEPHCVTTVAEQKKANVHARRSNAAARRQRQRDLKIPVDVL